MLYQVLSDPEQRACYDQTGLLPGQQLESEIFKRGQSTSTNIQLQFKRLINWKEEYQNSQEERQIFN